MARIGFLSSGCLNCVFGEEEANVVTREGCLNHLKEKIIGVDNRIEEREKSWPLGLRWVEWISTIQLTGSDSIWNVVWGGEEFQEVLYLHWILSRWGRIKVRTQKTCDQTPVQMLISYATFHDFVQTDKLDNVAKSIEDSTWHLEGSQQMFFFFLLLNLRVVLSHKRLSFEDYFILRYFIFYLFISW